MECKWATNPRHTDNSNNEIWLLSGGLNCANMGKQSILTSSMDGNDIEYNNVQISFTLNYNENPLYIMTVIKETLNKKFGMYEDLTISVNDEIIPNDNLL
jgi:hypothetical protein